MKRRAEYLVSKRDGRREWLRATKLARSVHLALRASGEADRARSLDLATALVGSLLAPKRFGLPPRERSVDTRELAAMVQRELVAAGYSLAALLYAQAGQRQRVAADAASPEDRLAADDAGQGGGMGGLGVAEPRDPSGERFWSDDRLFGCN